jgi:hypothetical protein
VDLRSSTASESHRLHPEQGPGQRRPSEYRAQGRPQRRHALRRGGAGPAQSEPAAGIALGWDDIRDLPAGSLFTKTFPDDTLPGGPVERTISYQAPFVRPDREQDYRTAWAFFQQANATARAASEAE